MAQDVPTPLQVPSDSINSGVGQMAEYSFLFGELCSKISVFACFLFLTIIADGDTELLPQVLCNGDGVFDADGNFFVAWTTPSTSQVNSRSW